MGGEVVPGYGARRPGHARTPPDAPDLLAANKQAVNQAYEIMGFRTALAQGWLWHVLSSRVRPDADGLRNAMQNGGLKAALQWRDAAFKKEGFE